MPSEMTESVVEEAALGRVSCFPVVWGRMVPRYLRGCVAGAVAGLEAGLVEGAGRTAASPVQRNRESLSV
jgi:hypothetical protein